MKAWMGSGIVLWVLVGCGSEGGGASSGTTVDGVAEAVADVDGHATDVGDDGALVDIGADLQDLEVQEEQENTDTAAGSDDPLLGLLSFRVVHNLQTPACLPGDCDMKIHEDSEPEAWLETLREYSNLAVLHWDRAIPYHAFRDALPAGEDRLAFYEARLEPEVLAWIEAYRGHFAAAGKGFLAVSLLAGSRDRYQPVWTAGFGEAPLGDTCPDFTPGLDLTVEIPGEGAVTLDVGAAYRRFLLYLHDKLQPDYMALLVEANLLKTFCPARWPGLVAYYHELYGALRAEAPDLPLFATLVLLDLLGWDEEACSDLSWSPCDQAPGAILEPVDAAACFPIDRSAIDDLDAGGHLDLLALSFYPDAMLMQPDEVDPLIRELNHGDWDGEAPCWMQASYRPFIDPFARIDALGWEKPVAFAEWSARSCPTLAHVLDEAGDSYWGRPGGNPTNQIFWLEHALDFAEEKAMPFVVWSFLADYDPLPLWLVEQSVLDKALLSLVNTWACSGVLDIDMLPKGAFTERWMEALTP